MKSWFCLMLVMCACSVLAADKFMLVDQGTSAVRIVIGDQPAESVSFAARELQTYVKKMSGAELPIVAKSEPGKPAILLGNAARGRLPKGDLAGILRDGYLIEVDQGNLCIVGLDDAGAHTDIEALLAREVTHDVAAWNFHRGTLYGVYRLLEELGVRWYLPGALGERVPERKTLTFSGEIRENPHFITRSVSSWSRIRWKGKRRRYIMPGEGDEIGFTAAENRMWELHMRGESFRIPLNHYPGRARWPERFGKEHPEYFALYADGSRGNTEGRFPGHLCYSQPGVVRESVADIRAFAAGAEAGTRSIPMTRPDGRVPSGVSSRYPYNRGWPDPIALGDYFSLTPQDAFKTPCACPECAKLVLTDVDRVRQRLSLYSRLVWDYVARVAEGLAADDVTKRMFVTCLAYGSQSYPYPGMRHLPSNVVVGICVGPYQNPTSWGYGDTLEQYETFLREWAPLTDNPLAFWQHYLSVNRKQGSREKRLGLPEHVPELYAKGIRLMAKYGNHVFCEMGARSIMFEAFNRYLLLKLFYDPGLNEREILDDFLNGFYGPDAGPIIGEIYADINRNTMAICRRHGSVRDFPMLMDGWTGLYTAEVLRSYRAKTAAAAAKAAGTPYAKAVAAFDKYYLGLMERGREHFCSSEAGKAALNGPNPELTCRYDKAPVVVNGRLDEPVWRKAVPIGMYNVATGATNVPATEVRACYDDRNIYFGIIAKDPNARRLSRAGGEPGTVDALEVFLDTDRDKHGYYQVTFDLAGGIDERLYLKRNQVEPARTDWRSGAQWKTAFHDDHYVMEIALPLASFKRKARNLDGVTWGVLVGRTALAASKRQFSSTSAALRNAFHQPALFNRLVFYKRIPAGAVSSANSANGENP